MRRVVTVLAFALIALPVAAQTDHLELKWMRDSEEFQALFLQTYHLAGDVVAQRADALPRGTAWAVVLDLDETVFNNQVYQLERAAYEAPFDTGSWNAWVRRKESTALPGVADFIARVRQLGGHVAWISDRGAMTTDETRGNLQQLGLWNDQDRLCLLAQAYPKRARRSEVRTGQGACAWQGTPMRVLAYFGDNIKDFPEADEEPGAFGVNWFVLPNPSYGGWQRAVTRQQH